MSGDESLKTRLRKPKPIEKDPHYTQKLEDLKKALPILEKKLSNERNQNQINKLQSAIDVIRGNKVVSLELLLEFEEAYLNQASKTKAMSIKENISIKQELSDTEQNDSQLNEQACFEPSSNTSETPSQHILGSFNELFEQFVVFKRDKDEFDEKMELERVIQKDRLQILEDNFKLIKSKLRDFISPSINNKDDCGGENDQSIECTKGRKSKILAKETSRSSQMDDEHQNNHEESSVDLKKITSTHNGKHKVQKEIKIKEESNDDLENEKAKKKLLKTMELDNLVDNNDDESMDEEQEEISIASLTNTAQTKVISKKAKSPTKRAVLKNVEELNDDDQDDKDIDNFLKSADRTLRSRLKVNYKSESENELETKNETRKKSSKQEQSDHENEVDEEECDDEKSASSQLAKDDLTLANILNESKEKEEDLKHAMHLNSDLIDSLEENNENVEDEEEGEDEETEKKKEKKATESDEKSSASKLPDEEKKSKLNLKVPNLCISDSSSDEDETKKGKDEKKTKETVIKEEEEEATDDVVTMKSEKKQKETKAKSSKSDLYSDEDEDHDNEKIHVRKATTRKSKLKSDSEESVISLNEEDSSSESNKNKSDSVSEEETSKKRKRIKLKSSESESESGKKSKKTKKQVKKKGKKDESDDDVVPLSDEEDAIENSQSRQKLRKIIGDEKLTEETKNALAEERERKKRIEEKRRLEKEAIEKADSERIVEDVFLDIDSETKKPIIAVDKSIVKFLKDHQIEGVKFLWDSCFEKVDLIKKDHKGSGCILAHCMGLGKTLTTITLVHTVLAHKELTRVNRVLIMVPVNVLNNWKNEIHQWTGKCKKKIDVYEMPTSASGGYNLVKTRLNELERWFNKGGVFLIGYQIFQILIAGRNIKPKKAVETFKKYLTDPGPDLIVCDEGHFLKNEQTGLSKAVTQVATRRRIALTGTPLQNNLVEYHCMVSFVKPNLLGNIKEFRNRFVNPINNGQHKNSTDSDVRYMKKRAHVLNNALDGVVHRKDYSYFKACLPPKLEYVLSIRLSSKQIELYRAYLKNGGLTKLTSDFKMQNGQLFTDFQELSRVWTHPWVLKLNEVRQIRNEEKRDEDDFVTEGESDASDSEASGGDDAKKSESKSDEHVISDEDTKSKDDDDDIMEIEPSGRRVLPRRGINGGGINKTESEIFQELAPASAVQRWWTDLVGPECEFDIYMSGKLAILEKIIEICYEKEDKLLVFSQSLLSLDIIEKYLEFMMESGKGIWEKDKDYFRMDGQTDLVKRKNHVKQFNDPDNKRNRLFLISTKAGGIGINLIGANRCVVFDASWNPSYDTQSIYRIYRIGQTKEVFVYRFLAQGTMEEKIYQRQIAKQSLSQRVVDSHQLERHFTDRELRELYAFEPDIYDPEKAEVPIMPSDDLLKYLLSDCKKWILRYHEHDSLLENKLSEGLSEEERKAAWDEYEAEKNNVRRAPVINGLNYINEEGFIPQNVTNWSHAELLQHYQQRANNQANNLAGHSNQEAEYQFLLQLQQQRKYQEYILHQQKIAEQQKLLQSQRNQQELLRRMQLSSNPIQALQHMTPEEKHQLAQQARMQLQRNNQLGLRTQLINNQIASTSPRNQISNGQASSSNNGTNAQNRNSLLAQALNPQSHHRAHQQQNTPNQRN